MFNNITNYFINLFTSNDDSDINPDLSITTFEDYNKNYYDKISLKKYTEIRQKLLKQKEHEKLVEKWNIILPKEKFNQLIDLMFVRIVNEYDFGNSYIHFEFNVTDFSNEQFPNFIKNQILSELQTKLKVYNINISSSYLHDENYPSEEKKKQHIIVLTNNTMYGF